MIKGLTVQKQKGWFKIQEVKYFKSIPVEHTPHDSFNIRNRFTVTTKEIQFDFDCPQLLVFGNNTKNNKWIMFNELNHVDNFEDNNSNSSCCFNQEEEEKKK